MQMVSRTEFESILSSQVDRLVSGLKTNFSQRVDALVAAGELNAETAARLVAEYGRGVDEVARSTAEEMKRDTKELFSAPTQLEA